MCALASFRRVLGLTPTLLTMIMFSCVGCFRQASEIAVVPRTTSTTIWETEHAGAVQAASSTHTSIRWNAPTREDDVQQQIAMVQRAVERHSMGLVLTPDQPLALMTPVKRALAVGVPTVVLASALPLPQQSGLTYILNDDELAGEMGALRVADVLSGRGRVAVMGIRVHSLSSLAMLHAFVATLESRFPNIEVTGLYESTENNIDAEVVAGQLLQDSSHLGAVFSLNSTDTVGCYLALKDKAMSGTLKLIGVEQSTELANAIRAKQVDALIAEDTYHMGFLAVQILTHQTPSPHGLTRLPPILITAENVDLPSIQPLITNDRRRDRQ